MEDMGEARLLYGYCGDHLHLANKIRSFLEGMQSVHFCLLDQRRYLPHVNQFVNTLHPDVRTAMVDISLRFDPDGVGDNPGGDLKKIHIGEPDISETGSVAVDAIGTIRVYAKIGDDVCLLSSENATAEPINMAPGDFVIASPYAIPTRLLKNFSIDKAQRVVRDFLLLKREA